MPVHSYFVLVAFAFLGGVLAVQILSLGQQAMSFLGTPTIEKRYYYSGKVAIFSSWLMFFLKAFYPRMGYIYIPDELSWVAVGILYTGVIIQTVSFINLGTSLKVGLPKQETRLKTRGIYRLSRNPIYVGVFLVSTASCIYFPDLINVSFTLYGIYIHHKIIREEERFLWERFGADWVVYSSKVRRYV